MVEEVVHLANGEPCLVELQISYTTRTKTNFPSLSQSLTPLGAETENPRVKRPAPPVPFNHTHKPHRDANSIPGAIHRTCRRATAAHRNTRAAHCPRKKNSRRWSRQNWFLTRLVAAHLADRFRIARPGPFGVPWGTVTKANRERFPWASLCLGLWCGASSEKQTFVGLVLTTLENAAT